MNYDQVATNLWVGGVPTDGEHVGKKFDALVLSAKEFQDVMPDHKHPNINIIRVPLNDAKPTREEKAMALDAALKVHALNKEGKKVLVTCAAGVNRSAMIAALAQVIGGVPAGKAINRIRKYRKPVSGSTPLFNRHFVQFIHEVDDSISTPDSHTR